MRPITFRQSVTRPPFPRALTSSSFAIVFTLPITSKFSARQKNRSTNGLETFHLINTQLQLGGSRAEKGVTRRLCLMNMFLHNIGEIDGESPVSSTDALIADGGKRYDYVLANPPFGKKSSMTFTNEEGDEEKEDLV